MWLLLVQLPGADSFGKNFLALPPGSGFSCFGTDDSLLLSREEVILWWRPRKNRNWGKRLHRKCCNTKILFLSHFPSLCWGLQQKTHRFFQSPLPIPTLRVCSQNPWRYHYWLPHQTDLLQFQRQVPADERIPQRRTSQHPNDNPHQLLSLAFSLWIDMQDENIWKHQADDHLCDRPSAADNDRRPNHRERSWKID